MSQRFWQFGPLSQFLGVMTEYYDINIIGATLPILTKVFFAKGMPPALAAFYVVAGLAVSYITRPIGAVIWGHYSDRIGRKFLMIASMAGMAVATAVIGLLPSYAQAGFTGIILLVIIRMFVGIFYGGEKASSVTYAQEFTPPKWRGLVGGFGQTATGVGIVLSSLTTGVFLSIYGSDMLIAYAWRYIFFFGIIPFAVVVFVRVATVETPIWQDAKTNGKLQKAPVASLLKGGTRIRFLQTMIMVIGFLLMGGVTSSYIAPILTNAPASLNLSQELIAYNAYGVAQIFPPLLVGWLSEYVGRKRTLIIYAIIGIITWVPTNYAIVRFGASFDLIPIVLLAFWYGASGIAPYPVIEPYLTERFGTSHRASGTGISYTLGNMVAGICSVILIPVMHGLLARIETAMSVWLSVGIVGMLGCVIGLVGAYIGPETVGIKLAEVEAESIGGSGKVM